MLGNVQEREEKITSFAEPLDPTKPDDGVTGGVQSIWFIVEPNGAKLAEDGLARSGEVSSRCG
jgi:hypothetical protein